MTSLVVDVEGGVQEEASAKDRLIEYDLWLVHTNPSGAMRSRHIVTTGAHGMPVPFAFSSFRFAVPSLTPDQFDFEVTSRVSGQLRGRFDDDGSIAVELLGGRADGLERAGGGYGGRSGEGRKQLRIARGDTVEIELPTSGGVMGVFATPDAAAANAQTRIRGFGGPPASVPPPISIVDGRLQVAFQGFFEGHRLALLIQARAVS